MSSLQSHSQDRITPPSSFTGTPLTPPPTGEKAFTQAPQVIALFKEIRAGRHGQLGPWTEFPFKHGEYDELERQLRQDELLFGYVKDKIRYDCFGESPQLVVVRMPTPIHELFIDRVEDTIRDQLKAIRSGSDRAAIFAKKVQVARSTEIFLPSDSAPSITRSKHEPDTCFWHDNAIYPGIVIEISYSQKRKKLGRLAEDYLLGSHASVQVVVGLDIEYGKKDLRKATLSVWRTHVVNGNEIRVVQEIADEAFRNDQGDPTDHAGLRFYLSDFAHEKLAQDTIGYQHKGQGQDREFVVSTKQLCEYLDAAESARRLGPFSKNEIAPGFTIQRRSLTPPEEITSSDE
ncbi:hypothetical protein GQ44DRAFT_779736 [Phaeosphaeriaceae sp. PMI808]|nr:hypothetical protein GQ44DRAFT_779736 [Phaeosphaeriaceae sp. PMI808]